MVGVGLKQFLEAAGVKAAPHLTLRSRDNLFSGLNLLFARGPPGKIPHHICARRAADLQHEHMTALLDELRQSEVETGVDLRPGIHRDAEAGTARLTTIDRDDEGVVATNFVRLVEVLACEKDPVLDGDRAELAGAHAKKGERLRCLFVLDDREAIALAAGLPEPLDWRMEKALPGMRPDGLAEERSVAAPLEPISPTVLLIGPSHGQFIEAPNGLVDDRTIAHRRADNPVALARQSVNDPLQGILLNREVGAEHIR